MPSRTNMESVSENFTSSMWPTLFRSFPLRIVPRETPLRHWLQINLEVCGVSVNHQFEVHKAPAFLPVVLDVGSPQSALDVDKDTSCQTENSRDLLVWAKSVYRNSIKWGWNGGRYYKQLYVLYILRALFYTEHKWSRHYFNAEILSSS